VLRQKLADQRSPDELAVVQQNIGDAHMRLGEYREAAVEFKALLDSPARRGQQNDQLVKQLLDAYLGARDYEQATRFAAEQIAANRAYQTILGPTITNEAERLKDPESALRLVTLALKMDPPLDATFAERLRKVQRGLEGKAPAPPATEPSG